MVLCCATLNNLELQHDLERGRESGADRQTETMMMEDGMKDGEVK